MGKPEKLQVCFIVYKFEIFYIHREKYIIILIRQKIFLQ
jgi:hypothetical protein